MKKNQYEDEIIMYEEHEEQYIKLIIVFLMILNFGFIYFCREVLNQFHSIGNIFIFTDISLVLIILIYFLFEKTNENKEIDRDN